jgi:hypothetical protein
MIIAAAIILSGVALINRASGRPAPETETRRAAPGQRPPQRQRRTEPAGRH